MFKNHPKGLLTAALSNMGERFGYYIMNAVLVLFLCSKFGLSEAASGTIYSFFYAGIYILSLVGGLIADRTQNYKGTIKTGLVVMATGYIILSNSCYGSQHHLVADPYLFCTFPDCIRKRFVQRKSAGNCRPDV